MAERRAPNVEQLIARYRDTGDIALRDRVVADQLYLAQMVARKFDGRGVEYDDLYQVASLALVKAVDRFDAERGLKFSTFVVPTMVGEVKNYFRYKMRLIRLPRGGSEAVRRIAQAEEQLHMELQRSPSAPELAQALAWRVEDVLEALEMRRAVGVDSLDRAAEDEAQGIGERIGAPDQALLAYEDREVLTDALRKLDEDDRRLVRQRFFENRSQRDVAALWGVSQMTVSRREKRALQRLRALMGEDE